MFTLNDTQCSEQRSLFPFLAKTLVLSLTFLLCLTEVSAQTATQSDPFDRPVSQEFVKVQQALDDDNYDLAEKLLSKMAKLAARAKKKVFLEEILAAKKDAARLKREFPKISEQVETLKKNPKDPQANEIVGSFYCAEKGDWGRGLQLLTKAENPTIRQTAFADLRRPVHPADQVKLADAWWKLVEETEKPFRKACLLRGRYWYLLARPKLKLADRVNRDKRLEKIALDVDKIIIWNQHNGRHYNCGTVSCRVTLLYQGKSVWRKVVQLPWKPDAPAFRIVEPPHIQSDQVRVDVVKIHGLAGGLGEVEVFDGVINVAKNCSVLTDNFYENDRRFLPENIIDGDTSGETGYWLLDKGRKGWVTINMVKLR